MADQPIVIPIDDQVAPAPAAEAPQTEATQVQQEVPQAQAPATETPIVMNIGPTTDEAYSLPSEQIQQAEPVVPAPQEPAPQESAFQQPLQSMPPDPAPAPQSASANVTHQITLDQLVDLCIEKEASDIHFGEDSKIALRVRGKLVFIENIDSLSVENAQDMIYSMIATKEDIRRLEHLREMDFSYTHSSGVSFRVNAFFQKGRIRAVMRMVSKHIPDLENLGVPEELKKKLSLRKGLIIVSGISGSGKSTTMQSMLEYINTNFVEHIITIESPIEYVFNNKKSIFSQREVGKDTLSAANALHAAVKEDPNVIMVSDIDSFETLDAALLAAEAGYFVIASMPTKDVRQTLERMFFMCHESDQKRGQDRIAETVIAILAQDLVQRADRSGRVAVYELMIPNSPIKTIIKSGNLSQLTTVMQSSGSTSGMMTMDKYAYQLAQQGIITQEVAATFSEQD